MKKNRHDPAGFAKRVSEILTSGNHQKAYSLVANAEKAGLDCMVAWNMVLDWKMRKMGPQEAFKSFNDVSLFRMVLLYSVWVVANDCFCGVYR